MSELHYSLNYRDYTVKNALLWGNFRGHCALMMEGKWGHRVVHAGIAFIQFWPIISQIASLFEMLIVKSCLFNAIIERKKLKGSPRKIKKINTSEASLDPLEKERLENLYDQNKKLLLRRDAIIENTDSTNIPEGIPADVTPPLPTHVGTDSPLSGNSTGSSDSETPVNISITPELQKVGGGNNDNCILS